MTLRAQAYDAFTQHLLDRRLLPGQFVSQRELAAQTGMSLGAIREMIPRLEAEGLIKPISQRGLQIARIDLEMVHDAFGLRKMIETAAIASFVRHASDAEVASHCDRLERIVEAVDRAGGTALPAELLAETQDADWALHDAFVGRLRNQLVQDIHRVNSIRIRMILQERIGISEERIPVAISEHQAMMAAIVRRDEAGAVAQLQAHLASSHRRALDFDGLGGGDKMGTRA
jgi:DNA-binding GntR family transcriptional regulator